MFVYKIGGETGCAMFEGREGGGGKRCEIVQYGVYHSIVPRGIREVDRIVPDISVGVGASAKPDRIFGKESPRCLIMISCAIVIDPSFGVVLPTGVLICSIAIASRGNVR
jgi:hypothetical protein